MASSGVPPAFSSMIIVGDGSTVRFTTDAYFLPYGDCIDGEGIEPDIPASRKESVPKAIEVLDTNL